MVCLKFNEFKKNKTVEFSVDPIRYIMAKLDSVPETLEKVFAIIKDQNEITVVAQEGFIPQGISLEGPFRRIRFDVSLPENLVGFVAHVSTLLANKNISILVFSAYSTDHLLVKEKDLERAEDALLEAGETYGKRSF